MSVELVPVISGVMVCLLAIYALVIKRSITLSERNTADLVDELSKEIQGISHGSMGVGRKVLALEKKIELLEAQIEEMQKAVVPKPDWL